MINSTYKVLTPAGQFDAVFAEDEDIPIEYSGDEVAITFFKNWLFINQVSGEHGHLLDSQSLTPNDLYGFCQPPESGIEVMPPFEDLLAYIQEDAANPVEDNDEQPQEENTMQANDMVTDNSLDGVYTDADKEAIAATNQLIKYFRDFIASDFDKAKVPTSIYGWTAAGQIMDKEDAKRRLRELIDVAINRKAGIEDITPKQKQRLIDYQHDARVISDYLTKRIRQTGSRNLLRTPEMKAKFPEIDNQPRDEFDSAVVSDEVENIGDATLDGISGIEKIKLIKEAGSLRLSLQTAQSGMEKLKIVKRIKEIRDALGVSSSAEFKEPSKLFDVYLEETGGDAFEAAKEFYKSELQGKIVKTVIGDVHMNGSSWREMKRGMKSDELKAKLIPKVPLILSGGKYDGKMELNKDRQDGFVAFHFFEMDVNIDSIIVTAGVNVGERSNGEYVYTVYGIGHDGIPNWIKKKATPKNSLDAALIRGESFRCPGVPSEPTAKPGSPISPLLTMDSILDESDDEVNIVILRVIKDNGERMTELEDNFEQQATTEDVNKVMPLLKQFIGKSQLSAIGMGIRGEEGQFFKNKLIEIANVIQTMPKTYGQDGMGDKAIAYLHYFKGSGDWHITEKDMEDEQLQAFGLANIGYGGELGYISIEELIDAGVELDLYWEPKTIGEIKGKSNEDENQGTETGGDETGGESTEITQSTEEPQTVMPVDTIRAGFVVELEALESETDINRFNERLDEIAARVEQAGLMESLDKELNDAADVLTRLLSEAEKAS